jgi:hypothetical protein
MERCGLKNSGSEWGPAGGTSIVILHKITKFIDQLGYYELLRRNSLIPYVEEKLPPGISERRNLF